MQRNWQVHRAMRRCCRDMKGGKKEREKVTREGKGGACQRCGCTGRILLGAPPTGAESGLHFLYITKYIEIAYFKNSNNRVLLLNKKNSNFKKVKYFIIDNTI